MPSIKHIIISILVLLALANSSCLKSKKPGIPPEVIQTLNNSGIQKPNLLKVILAFQKQEDSLKLQSAYYLIQNLESNYSLKITLKDSNNLDVVININDFSDYQSIKKYIDSLEITSGKLIYKTDSILLDINNVSSVFLISHINNSVNIFQNTTWGSDYDINTYYNNILPYRIANEKIEPYTSHLHNKYKYITDKEHDITKIALHINNLINNELSYDNRLEITPNIQSIKTIEKSKSGNWRDINIYKVKALRSIGIAAALDYTPYFSDSILGYYSTTVILPDKKILKLPNSDNNQIQYQQGKTAKVYRRSFKYDSTSLFTIKDKKIHTPPFLGNFNYIDVTNEYLQTESISINITDTSKYVYLAVYNENSWKPIEWAIVQPNGKVNFYNMGTEIIYMPVVVSEDSIISIGEPFLLNAK
ncbi:MAG: hypothetical protein QM503_02325 [Bacteroidota bacterium]